MNQGMYTFGGRTKESKLQTDSNFFTLSPPAFPKKPNFFK